MFRRTPKLRVFTRCPITGEVVATLLLMTRESLAQFSRTEGEALVPCEICEGVHIVKAGPWWLEDDAEPAK